jgi:hypothetical protein
MKTLTAELEEAQRELDLFHLDNAKCHIDNALQLQPDNLEALELASWHALQVDINQARALAYKYLLHKQQLNSDALTQSSLPRLRYSNKSPHTPKISLICSSRYVGNSSNQFANFLNSIVKHTEKLQDIELIVRVDEDDDIEYFSQLLKVLPTNLNWKLLSGARGAGFMNRTNYIWEAMDYLDPVASYVLPLSDNAVFVVADWDAILLKYLQVTLSSMVNLTENKHFQLTGGINEIIWMLFRQTQPCYFVVNHKLADYIKNAFSDKLGCRSNYNLDLIFELVAHLLNEGKSKTRAVYQQIVRSQSGTGHASLSVKDKQLWAMLDYYDLLENDFYQICSSLVKQFKNENRATVFTLRRLKATIKEHLRRLKNKSFRAKPQHHHNPLTQDDFFTLSDQYFKQGKLVTAQIFYREGLAKFVAHKLKSHVPKNFTPTILTHDFCAPSQQSLISLMMGCRLKNNTNSKLKNFLTSIVKTAHQIEAIEVMIALDHDDDIDKIFDILKDFKQLRIVPVLMARNRGYYDLHQKYTKLYEYIAASSRAVMICSDDSFFSRNAWDQDMVTAMQNYQDDLVFYNLFIDRDLVPALKENTFMWWLFQRNPATIYPAVGRGVIEAIKNTISHDDQGWSSFGNSLMVDSFFEMLRWHFYHVSGVSRTVNISNAIERMLDSTAIPDNNEKLAMRYRDGLMLYADKLSDDFQRKVNQIANVMTAALTD